MSTDIELAGQVRFLPSEHEAGRIGRLAHAVANTEFVPKTLRGKPEAIMAAMLTGREIGIGPMHALRGIDVIDGRPSLSAELMASLVMRAGHMMWVLESTAEMCTMAGRRHDWPDRIPDMDLTWSMDDARQAGLANKQNWQKYPRAMLRARATSELCRAIFPDVVERVGYVAEELGSEEPPDQVAAVEVVRQVAGDEVADQVARVYDAGEVVAEEPAASPEEDPDDDDAEDAEEVDDTPLPAETEQARRERAAEVKADNEAVVEHTTTVAADTPNVGRGDQYPEPAEELSPAEHDRRKFFAILTDEGLDYEADVKPWMVDTYGVSLSKLAGNPEMAELLSKLDKPTRRAKFRVLLSEWADARTADEPAEPDPAPETEVGEGPYDWRADAQARGVHLTEVLRQLRDGWVTSIPGGTQPNRTSDIDRLVESDPVSADQVRVLVADLAAGKAGAA